MKVFVWLWVRWNEIVGAFFYGIKQQTVTTDARENIRVLSDELWKEQKGK